MLKMYKYLKFGKTIINIFAVENGHCYELISVKTVNNTSSMDLIFLKI
jgi:hypothetical protein